MRSARKRCLTPFLLLLPLFLCSCSPLDHYITVSPDSAQYAYVTSTRQYSYSLFSPEPHIYRRDLSATWGDLRKPQQTKKIELGSLAGPQYDRWGGDVPPMDIQFSQDCQFLCVLTPLKLVCIKTSDKTIMVSIDSNRQIKTFRWISPQILMFTRHRAQNVREFVELDLQTKREKILLEIHDQGEMYQAVEDFGGRFALTEQSGYWDPSGKYVLFNTDWKLQLADMATREIFTPSFQNVFGGGIGWTSDGSRVFCLLGNRGDGGMIAFTMDPVTHEIHDYSSQFRSSFKLEAYQMGFAGWSFDNRWLLFNDCLGVGAFLVQLDPWKVVYLNDILMQKLSAQCKPYVLPVPIKGFVQIYSPGTGLAEIDNEGNITRYDPIAKDAFGPVTVSPNGKYAIFQINWTVHVQPLEISVR
jgi:hypothetical protein